MAAQRVDARERTAAFTQTARDERQQRDRLVAYRVAVAGPQLAAREMIVPLDHLTAGPIRVLGTPLKLSGTPAAVRTPPPALGQHTATILEKDLGFTQSEIESLRMAGAIS